MPFERYTTIYHDYVPDVAAQVYAVPSGFQALVKPTRIVNTSGASNSVVSLYQGTLDPERVYAVIDVDADGMVIDDSPVLVASGYPLLAGQTLASGVTMHMTAILTPQSSI